MIYSLDGVKVQFDGESFVAENATVVGNVSIGKNVSIWFNTVIRGDSDLIRINDNANIQDGSVLHTDPGYPMLIGNGVTVGHKVMLHGCTIGEFTLIGINSVVLNGAKIGKYCLIGANTLVPENMEIPDGSLVVGSPAKIKRSLTEEQQKMLEKSAEHYVENGRRFSKGLERQ